MVYEAITTNKDIATAEGEWKRQYYSHRVSLSNKKNMNSTSLSTYLEHFNVIFMLKLQKVLLIDFYYGNSILKDKMMIFFSSINLLYSHCKILEGKLLKYPVNILCFYLKGNFMQRMSNYKILLN